ncbi:MAG: hypothetical protein KBT05_06740, partial [Bacteroidales bacterium]|nr:hypothetical protein [Candidatus Cryptobacteroides caccocaballi]
VSKFLIPSATGAATEAMYFSKEIVEYKLLPILETSGLEDVRGTAFYLEYRTAAMSAVNSSVYPTRSIEV